MSHPLPRTAHIHLLDVCLSAAIATVRYICWDNIYFLFAYSFLLFWSCELTFINTDSLSFSRLIILMATLRPSTQCTPNLTKPRKKARSMSWRKIYICVFLSVSARKLKCAPQESAQLEKNRNIFGACLSKCHTNAHTHIETMYCEQTKFMQQQQTIVATIFQIPRPTHHQLSFHNQFEFNAPAATLVWNWHRAGYFYSSPHVCLHVWVCMCVCVFINWDTHAYIYGSPATHSPFSALTLLALIFSFICLLFLCFQWNSPVCPLPSVFSRRYGPTNWQLSAVVLFSFCILLTCLFVVLAAALYSNPVFAVALVVVVVGILFAYATLPLLLLHYYTHNDTLQFPYTHTDTLTNTHKLSGNFF